MARRVICSVCAPFFRPKRASTIQWVGIKCDLSQSDLSSFPWGQLGETTWKRDEVVIAMNFPWCCRLASICRNWVLSLPKCVVPSNWTALATHLATPSFFLRDKIYLCSITEHKKSLTGALDEAHAKMLF